MLGYLGTSWTIFMMQRFEIAEVAKNIQKPVIFLCFCSLSRCYVGAFWSLVGAPSCFHGASEASGVRSKIHAPKMLPRCLHTHQCFKTLRHKQQSSKCYTTLKTITRFPFFCQARFFFEALMLSWRLLFLTCFLLPSWRRKKSNFGANMAPTWPPSWVPRRPKIDPRGV